MILNTAADSSLEDRGRAGGVGGGAGGGVCGGGGFNIIKTPKDQTSLRIKTSVEQTHLSGLTRSQDQLVTH